MDSSGETDLAKAFATMSEQKVGALLVMADPVLNFLRRQIIELAGRYAVPAIYEWREFAVAGGLMSYGTDVTDAYRRVGVYTGKVLGGAQAAELPIDQAAKVELVLNLKTAKTLGVTFPLSLIARADEVIE